MGMITTIIFIFGLIMCFVAWCTDNKDVAAVILTIHAVIFGVVPVAVKYPQFVCEQKTELSGCECTWDFFAGCQINVKGQWIPYEKWRVVE